MRLVNCIAALASITAVNALPVGTYGDASEEPATKYFVNNLDGIQGALEDISKAGEDLNIIENKLEGLVTESVKIFKAESVLEEAVDKNVYLNSWKSSGKLFVDRHFE